MVVVPEVGALYRRKGVHKVTKYRQGRVCLEEQGKPNHLELPVEMFIQNYELVSPREMPKEFDFGMALECLKEGYAVCRKDWYNTWLCLQVPDERSKMTLTYIYIEYPSNSEAYPDGCRMPWLASQADMLADDWMLYEGSVD